MRRTGICLLVGLFSMVITAGIAQAASPEWWQQAAAPYKGSTVRVLGQKEQSSEVLRDIAAPAFEKLTGIKIEFECQPYEVFSQRIVQAASAGTGEYDLIYTEQDLVYGYLANNWLVDLTELMEKNPSLVQPDLDLADFTAWIDMFKDQKTGHLFSLPHESFLKMYVYRKDLFEDPEIKNAFKAAYGWELRPAKDWVEYRQIAKFFTEWGKQKGIELYGHVAQAKPGHLAPGYEFVGEFGPSWGLYNWGINLDNYRASVAKGGMINSDLAKEALQYYIDMLQYAPPAVRTYTWVEPSTAMAAGIVAQGLIYGTFLGAQICIGDSKVIGKIGVTVSPTTPECMNEAVRGLGYIGYNDGSGYSIPWASKNPKAAFLFMQWIVRKEFAVEYAGLASSVVRKSTFGSPKLQEIDEEQGGYFTASRRYEALYAGSPPFPMHSVLIEIIRDYVGRAIADEMTVDKALDTLAEKLDLKMEELGY